MVQESFDAQPKQMLARMSITSRLHRKLGQWKKAAFCVFNKYKNVYQKRLLYKASKDPCTVDIDNSNVNKKTRYNKLAFVRVSRIHVPNGKHFLIKAPFV